MRKFYYSIIFILGVLVTLFTPPLFANNCLEPLLDKVTLQLRAEQWVTTTTALVNVGINAAVTDQGIEKIQSEALQKLNLLSGKGEWHIVSFDRQLDKSGLESIQITAQARLPQSELSNLRNKAKAISKAGETFTIDAVQFTPSEDEIRQANNTLRRNLYQQAKDEMDALNKVYPMQKYYLHQIDFSNTSPRPVMLLRTYAPQNDAAAGASNAATTPLPVGNKVELEASVIIASMPEQISQILTRK